MNQHEPSCERVRELLVPYLDGEADDDETATVARHLDVCPSCREVLQLHRRIGAGLEAICRPAPGLAEEAGMLAAAAQREARSRRRRTRRSVSLIGALAACALAAVVASWLGPREDPGAPGGVADRAGDEPILSDLEILEAFQEEGLEPSADLVQIILEEAEQGDGEILPVEALEEILEEELAGENL
jgi:anti-sigma factor RsiW